MDSWMIDLNYILKMFAVKIPFKNHFFSELNFLSYKWMWSSCSQGQDFFLCTPTWLLDLEHYIDVFIPVEVHWGTAETQLVQELTFGRGVHLTLPCLLHSPLSIGSSFVCVLSVWGHFLFRARNSQVNIWNSRFMKFYLEGEYGGKAYLNWTYLKKVSSNCVCVRVQ